MNNEIISDGFRYSLNSEGNIVMKKLQIENEELRREIDNILNDLNVTDSYDDIWERINLLVENEIQQEKESNQ